MSKQQTYPAQGTYPPADGKEKKGMMDSIKEGGKKVVDEIDRGLQTACTKINEEVDKNFDSPLLDQFKTGNVIQLVSKVTGRTVQIVRTPEDQLILDANGPVETNEFNTLWTVIDEGDNQVRIHNYDHYIAVINGQVVVKDYPPGTQHGLETKFQLSQVHKHYVTLEPIENKHHYIEFESTGQLKPTLSSSKENTCQFTVRLVSATYPDAKK